MKHSKASGRATPTGLNPFTPISAPIPHRPSPNDDIEGTAFGADPNPNPFPSSKHGKNGPFQIPSRPQPVPNSTFQDWVNYYVNLIGAELEIMNGFQANMKTGHQVQNAAKIATELGVLADALNTGAVFGNNIVPNPKDLRWPLAGSYTFLQDHATTGFNSLVVDLYFENEPTFRMTVNCTIVITSEVFGTGQQQSSSSSFVATSSSSR